MDSVVSSRFFHCKSAQKSSVLIVPPLPRASFLIFNDAGRDEIKSPTQPHQWIKVLLAPKLQSSTKIDNSYFKFHFICKYISLLFSIINVHTFTDWCLHEDLWCLAVEDGARGLVFCVGPLEDRLVYWAELNPVAETVKPLDVGLHPSWVGKGRCSCYSDADAVPASFRAELSQQATLLNQAKLLTSLWGCFTGMQPRGGHAGETTFLLYLWNDRYQCSLLK